MLFDKTSLFLDNGMKHKIIGIALLATGEALATRPIVLDADTTSQNFKEEEAGIWNEPGKDSRLWEVADFSEAYQRHIICESIRSNGVDATLDLKGFTLDAVDLFSSFQGGRQHAMPQNGIFGFRNKRLQIYISDYCKPEGKNTILVYGASKRGMQIHHFEGKITIRQILKSTNTNHNTPKDSIRYPLVADYELAEDRQEEGSGTFRGTFCADVRAELHYDYLDNKLKREIWTNNANEGQYGYSNRNFVGTWTSNSTGEKLKAIWGDNALPYALDFQIGVGEEPNEKYIDADWEQYLNTDNEIEEVVDDEGEPQGFKMKDEWWTR